MDLRDRYLNQQQLAAVLGLLIPKYARWHILRMSDLGTCIWGTKIALRIMEHYGVLNPRPAAVRVTAANPTYADMLKHLDPPRNRVELAQWARGGAFIMGCGYEDTGDPGTWPGHLVALADEFLVDLTADQFAHPEKDMEIEPLALRVNRAFVDGRERAVHVNEQGCLLTYEVSGDMEWETTPAWLETKVETELVARATIEEIDAVQDVDDLLTAVRTSL